jgi:hypothetical protein
MLSPPPKSAELPAISERKIVTCRRRRLDSTRRDSGSRQPGGTGGSTWLSTMRVSLMCSVELSYTAMAPPRPSSATGCTRLPLKTLVSMITTAGTRAPPQRSWATSAPPLCEFVSPATTGFATLLMNCEFVIASACPACWA